MKYILVNSNNGGNGFITHHDQEQDGLSFQVAPLDDGRLVASVGGDDIVITAWESRVGGKSISEGKKIQLVEATEKLGLEKDIPFQEAKLNIKKARLSALGVKVIK